MIKAIITTDAIDFISRYDGAVNLAKSDYAKYLETNDEAHLVFNEGEDPTRWKLRPLSQTQVRRTMGASMVDGGGTAMLMEVGARLLSVGLVGAKNFGDAEGKPSNPEWPTGAPAEVLESLPHMVQLELGDMLYKLCNGPVAGGLEDEGKLPSPSSSKGQGNSTRSVSAAPTVRPAKTSGASGGARSLRRSKS